MQSHFTDTIFYQVELTAKYCKLLGQQVFEKFGVQLSIEEFSVMNILSCNPPMCQRDVAKIILKDRASTGKLLDNLEKKGFITRNLSLRNNRPVKIVGISDKGNKEVEVAMKKLAPHIQLIKERIESSDLAKIAGLLKELREVLDSTLEMKI